MADLNEVIQDAITDHETPETAPETTVETTVEAAPEAPIEQLAEESTSEVASPASRVKDVDPAAEDEFAKRHGLAPQRQGDRENRIPYSAVKRIVGNAEKKAVTAATEPLTKELTELRTLRTDYEDRLQRVAQFEQVMVTDPAQFLNMLTRIPAYKQIFEQMSVAQQQQTTPAAPDSDMPQPDQTLQDGTKVYSMDGFKAYEQWREGKIRQGLQAEFDKRLQPFEQERQAREYRDRLVPQVKRQIDEARKWAQFSENEVEIVKALQTDPNLSLEGAYRQVVMPRLSTDYNAMRAKVLEEMKRAPVATSASVSASRPAAPVQKGPRDLTAVIQEAIDAHK